MHMTFNHGVEGPSPSGRTNFLTSVSSSVSARERQEHHSFKVGVVGSTPTRRTKNIWLDSSVGKILDL